MTESTRPAASTGWRVLILVSGAMFVTTLNFSMIVVAFPEIEDTFDGIAREQLSWALTIYTIVLAALTVPSGWLADRVGRKRMFLIGVALFTVGGALVAAAPGPGLLIGARAVQGAGAGVMTPAAVALVLASVPANRRSTAVGAFSAIAGLAAALGPVIGGFLVDATSWRWTFMLNVPVGALTFVVGIRLLTESKRSAERARPDLLGAAVLMVAVAGLAFGIVQSDQWGWTDPRVLGALLGSAVLVAWFLRRCAGHPAPVVDLGLFENRNFTFANVMAVLNVGSFSAIYLALVLFLTDVWGYDSFQAGLSLALIPAIAAPLSLVSGRLADRYGHRAVLVPGSLCWVTAMAWILVALGRETAMLAVWIPAISLYSVGVGLCFAAVEGAAVHGLPDHQLATGSAVHRIFNEIGSTLAVASAVVIVDRVDPAVSLSGFRQLFVVMIVAGALVGLLSLGIDTRPGRAPRLVGRSATVRSPGSQAEVSPTG